LTKARKIAVSAAADPGLAAVHVKIAAYYTAKVTKFGAIPFGVDWTCVPTQELRFVQLLRICRFASPLSINDVGCGYGALVGYLDKRHYDCTIDYLGIDLSAAMIRQARRLWHNRDRAHFVSGHVIPRIADYGIASGVFNVQLEQSVGGWESFVAKTLDHLNQTSARGFAVNFVKVPPRGSRRRVGLYTTEPEQWVNYCTAQFGAAAEVISDYGLREFTLLVRRNPVGTFEN
jgi:SAM-dependent methyltransferase